MPEALRWKSKLLLAKIEATYGLDPVPTQAILAQNVVCRPMEGEDVNRELELPYRGAQDEFPVGLRTTIEFDVELVGSGAAGTAPAFGPLLRALGLAEVVTPATKVEYSPISAAYESVALYFWIGGNRQAILGARGNAVITIAAQTIPKLRFTLTGLWVKPTAVALPAPNFTAFKTPLVATDVNTPTFTADGYAFVLRSYSFDLGNQVEPRLLIGREEIMIVDSAESIAANVEAVPLADFDPFAKSTALAKVPVIVEQDTRVGHRVKITAPLCSVRRLEGYENQQGILEWPLRFGPRPSDAGNDQFKIELT